MPLAFLALAILVGSVPARAESPVPSPSELDCAGDARALLAAKPVMEHEDGDELHQRWVLADRPDLWAATAPAFEPLARYRERVRSLLPDTSPLGLIRANRERNPWLERDHPAEARINRLVLEGLGQHRPMSCLESQILAFQARRFSLYEQPSEILALLLKRSDEGGDRLQLYIAADHDTTAPRPELAIEWVEKEVAAGWRLFAVFHNHTFNHSEDRPLIPVAAPSASDVQVSVALAERLGLERIFVSDGFSTLELTADHLRQLASALE